jgi:hypothetical protein
VATAGAFSTAAVKPQGGDRRLAKVEDYTHLDYAVIQSMSSFTMEELRTVLGKCMVNTNIATLYWLFVRDLDHAEEAAIRASRTGQKS